MKRAVVFSLLILLSADARAQSKLSLQAYGQYGLENSDNLYKTVGVDGFIESDHFFYAPSLAYLDATINTFASSASPAVYSGISVIEKLNSASLSTTRRYTIGNRLEYFHSSGFNAAITGSFAYETANYRSAYAYTYETQPLWDTTFRYNVRQIHRYLIGGLELSRFLEADKFGAGALYISDFEDVKKVQPYLFFVSSLFRRVVFRATAGAVIGNDETNPLAKVIVSWRTTPDIELKGSLLYSRTTFLYDIYDRFLSYYREKNEIQAGVLALYGLSPGIDLFAGVKYEKNKSFTMWIMTLGTYIHP